MEDDVLMRRLTRKMLDEHRYNVDASGVADVSSLTGGLRMSVKSERVSGDFIVDFTRDGSAAQQTIKMFHWECRANLTQGAIVQP